MFCVLSSNDRPCGIKRLWTIDKFPSSSGEFSLTLMKIKSVDLICSRWSIARPSLRMNCLPISGFRFFIYVCVRASRIRFWLIPIEITTLIYGFYHFHGCNANFAIFVHIYFLVYTQDFACVSVCVYMLKNKYTRTLLSDPAF